MKSHGVARLALVVWAKAGEKAEKAADVAPEPEGPEASESKAPKRKALCVEPREVERSEAPVSLAEPLGSGLSSLKS